MDRISESKSLSFRCKDKLVDLQMVCSFQKLLQAIPLRWRKSNKNEVIRVPRYLKPFTTMSSSRAFGGAPSLWYLCGWFLSCHCWFSIQPEMHWFVGCHNVLQQQCQFHQGAQYRRQGLNLEDFLLGFQHVFKSMGVICLSDNVVNHNDK